MKTQNILKLRDHWYYAAQGESWIPAIEFNFETSEALGEALVAKKHEQELGKALSSIISEVERLIISGKLDCGNKIAKNLEWYKSILSGRDKIILPKPNPKNARDI